MLIETLDEQTLSLVHLALKEDIGSGDVTAALIPENNIWQAEVICRETAVICGRAWFDAVFQLIDKSVSINWQATDADKITDGDVICSLRGPARALLTGERTALNFLQTLSGTATLANQYAEVVSDLETRILDTRKTIPGLRLAQKYAVRCGGCYNHRTGLYDAFLIKENHIAAAGSIKLAVDMAKSLGTNLLIEIEVENLAEMLEALNTGAKRLLLDNFSIEKLQEAVTLIDGRAKLEASGGITLNNLRKVAETGVDYISIGALTKDLHAIDLSMRFTSTSDKSE
jgi:nicotinate-nucleotide pyrophosphorylase (carboxylating)